MIRRFTTECKRKIGFVGLGNMGSSMSQHLLGKGHSVVVYDISPDAVKRLTKLGASSASTPAHVAEQASHVITMLPTNSEVLDVYTRPDGLIAGSSAGKFLMDSSTIDPNVSKKIAQLAQDKDVTFLDTPVSGAVPAARAATLTFMCGGTSEQVDAVRDILLCMGKNVIHCGPTGSGAAAKICNNMMLAISMIGASEALNLAQSLGLDPQLMTKILNVSSGRTWVSELYNPVPGINENAPAAIDYEGGFYTHLIAKDLRLAQTCANSSDVPTPMGSLAYQIYKLMINNGFHGKDFSIVYKYIKDKK